MPNDERDELIDAQKQVIGILFEIVKRQQTNSDLDQEYFELVLKEDKDDTRIKEIQEERAENSRIITRLLEQLES